MADSSSISKSASDPQGIYNGPAARFVTIGARVASTPDKLNGWDYNLEAAYETEA